MKLPKYIKNEYHLMLGILFPYSFLLNGQVLKRIGIALLMFIPLTALVNTFIFWLSAYMGFLGFKFNWL